MILTRDNLNEYTHQLTAPEKYSYQLEYALIQFRNSKSRHCVVKKDAETGKFAVFTDGRFMEKAEEPTPVKGFEAVGEEEVIC